jgi:hypothetical protein
MLPARCLILLAKEPLPGRAKTRLAAGVGPERAARLTDGFLRDTVRTCRAVRGAELWIAMEAESAGGYFRALCAEARLVVQPPGDLGARLRAAFDAAFAAGLRRVVAIGSDAPHLPSERIDAAFDALAQADAVLGPAVDGGYYLLGLRAPRPELFDGVAWSTPGVLRQTEERARRLGLDLARLPETFDVDTPDDLERLRELLAADASLCPATRALIAR